MQIQLSDHFNYQKLIRYSIPSIGMMIFTSIYVVIDGIFVSNFVGVTEFAALNLIFPFIMIPGALGFMLGTGGTALVAKTMGEGDTKRANDYFSMITYMAIILSAIIGGVCFAFITPIARLLGAEGEMVGHCVTYGRFMLAGLPFCMLQNIFQCFTMTAEKPKLGLYLTLAAGISNMIGDALLVGVFRFRLAGAAAASVLSQVVGGLVPLIYFARPNDSPLRLGRFYFKLRPFITSCINGLSEFVSNISASVVNMLYNYQLMAIAGQNGVSAFGIIMYTQFIFIGVFYGYSLATAPVIGYHYGAGNKSELKSLLKKSLILIGSSAAVLTLLAEVLSPTLAAIFVGYDAELAAMTANGIRLYCISFIICGFNIFGSAFFTALNDGITSGLISFMRTFVFQLASLLVLPALVPAAYKLDGIWLAIVAAEVLSLIVTAVFIITKRKKYGYM